MDLISLLGWSNFILSQFPLWAFTTTYWRATAVTWKKWPSREEMQMHSSNIFCLNSITTLSVVLAWQRHIKLSLSDLSRLQYDTSNVYLMKYFLIILIQTSVWKFWKSISVGYCVSFHCFVLHLFNPMVLIIFNEESSCHCQCVTNKVGLHKHSVKMTENASASH